MIHLIYWTRIPTGGERATPHSQRGESAQVPGENRYLQGRASWGKLFFLNTNLQIGEDVN